MSNLKLKAAFFIVILSGTLFYFSTGFHQAWPLLWLAPIPVLIYTNSQSYRLVAIVAFFAFFIGQLNALYYLGTGLPLPLILFSMTSSSVIFSILMLVNKWLTSKTDHWSALFFFPALWTSYEFLLSLVSSAGALMSLSYSQLHFIAFIQIVSITGIWGATFVLLSFSSGMSYAICSKKRLDKLISLAIAIILPLSCILYGNYRLQEIRKPLNSASVGLVSINVSHRIYDKEALSLSKQYVPLIEKAANSGAKFIVLPEKFVRVTAKTYQHIVALFQQTAKKYHVTLVLGIARFGQKNFNSAIIIKPNGKIAGIYNKHHLLPGPEDKFLPGKHYFTTQEQLFKWGVTICKDMDFPSLSRYYGKSGTQLLLVPALDFNIDAWYHGRSAIMRGLENGFAVARSAAHGNLSITDQMGRIIKLEPDFHEKNNVVVGTVALYPLRTIYSQWGNWFAWLILLSLALAVCRVVLRLKG